MQRTQKQDALSRELGRAEESVREKCREQTRTYCVLSSAGTRWPGDESDNEGKENVGRERGLRRRLKSAWQRGAILTLLPGLHVPHLPTSHLEHSVAFTLSAGICAG